MDTINVAHSMGCIVNDVHFNVCYKNLSTILVLVLNAYQASLSMFTQGTEQIRGGGGRRGAEGGQITREKST